MPRASVLPLAFGQRRNHGVIRPALQLERRTVTTLRRDRAAEGG